MSDNPDNPDQPQQPQEGDQNQWVPPSDQPQPDAPENPQEVPSIAPDTESVQFVLQIEEMEPQVHIPVDQFVPQHQEPPAEPSASVTSQRPEESYDISLFLYERVEGWLLERMYRAAAASSVTGSQGQSQGQGQETRALIYDPRHLNKLPNSDPAQFDETPDWILERRPGPLTEQERQGRSCGASEETNDPCPTNVMDQLPDSDPRHRDYNQAWILDTFYRDPKQILQQSQGQSQGQGPSSYQNARELPHLNLAQLTKLPNSHPDHLDDDQPWILDTFYRSETPDGYEGPGSFTVGEQPPPPDSDPNQYNDDPFWILDKLYREAGTKALASADMNLSHLNSLPDPEPEQMDQDQGWILDQMYRKGGQRDGSGGQGQCGTSCPEESLGSAEASSAYEKDGEWILGKMDDGKRRKKKDGQGQEEEEQPCVVPGTMTDLNDLDPDRNGGWVLGKMYKQNQPVFQEEFEDFEKTRYAKVNFDKGFLDYKKDSKWELGKLNRKKLGFGGLSQSRICDEECCEDEDLKPFCTVVRKALAAYDALTACDNMLCNECDPPGSRDKEEGIVEWAQNLFSGFGAQEENNNQGFGATATEEPQEEDPCNE